MQALFFPNISGNLSVSELDGRIYIGIQFVQHKSLECMLMHRVVEIYHTFDEAATIRFDGRWMRHRETFRHHFDDVRMESITATWMKHNQIKSLNVIVGWIASFASKWFRKPRIINVHFIHSVCFSHRQTQSKWHLETFAKRFGSWSKHLEQFEPLGATWRTFVRWRAQFPDGSQRSTTHG